MSVEIRRNKLQVQQPDKCLMSYLFFRVKSICQKIEKTAGGCVWRRNVKSKLSTSKLINSKTYFNYFYITKVFAFYSNEYKRSLLLPSINKNVVISI